MPLDSPYLSPMFTQEGRSKKLKAAIEVLRAFYVDFDVVVCRGVSGIMFGTMLAHALGKELLIVRKPGESSHSLRVLEGYVPDEGCPRILLVDDIIDSGNTMVAMVDALGTLPENSWELVGAYLWAPNAIIPADDLADYTPTIEKARHKFRC